jgi:hypothetical protein
LRLIYQETVYHPWIKVYRYFTLLVPAKAVVVLHPKAVRENHLSLHMCYIFNNKPTEAHCWNFVKMCMKSYLLINALHIQTVSIYKKQKGRRSLPDCYASIAFIRDVTVSCDTVMYFVPLYSLAVKVGTTW